MGAAPPTMSQCLMVDFQGTIKGYSIKLGDGWKYSVQNNIKTQIFVAEKDTGNPFP